MNTVAVEMTSTENTSFTNVDLTNGVDLSTVYVTETVLNTSEAALGDESKPVWASALENTQLVTAIIGFVSNVLTFVTLTRSGKIFGTSTLLLLENQALVDALVCLTASLLLLVPPSNMSGSIVFDSFLCHVWYSQSIYWWLVTNSSYTLVLIAFDRFLAVCYPFKHQNYTRPRTLLSIVIANALSLFDATVIWLQVTLVDGECTGDFLLTGHAADRFFSAFSFWVWLSVYAIPTCLFVAFYGKVIYSFKQRRNQVQAVSVKNIDKATMDLTKTAITVTLIFIICIGYDSNYYFAANVRLTEYVIGSPVQMVGIFLSSFNSVVNPFVYATLMPVFRKNMRKTLCFWNKYGAIDVASSAAPPTVSASVNHGRA